MAIQVGDAAVHEVVVTEAMTADQFGNPGFPVLATPMLAALCEQAAIKVLVGRLEPGQGSVGTRLELDHLAATPLGMPVAITATVTAMDGKQLVFALEARDAHEVVARGVHHRFLVQVDRFLSRVAQKRGG